MKKEKTIILRWDFDGIREQLAARVQKRFRKKRSRFGTAAFFRQYKKIRKQQRNRIEPPILNSPQVFLGEAQDYAYSANQKASKRRSVNF